MKKMKVLNIYSIVLFFYRSTDLRDEDWDSWGSLGDTFVEQWPAKSGLLVY